MSRHRYYSGMSRHEPVRTGSQYEQSPSQTDTEPMSRGDLQQEHSHVPDHHSRYHETDAVTHTPRRLRSLAQSPRDRPDQHSPSQRNQHSLQEQPSDPGGDRIADEVGHPAEDLLFETSLEERIYKYVERHGTVAFEDVRTHIGCDAATFRKTIASLKQDGYLDEHAGQLRIAYDAEPAAEDTDLIRDEEPVVTIRPAQHEDLTPLVTLIRTVSDETTYVVAERVAEHLAYEEAVIRHTTAYSRILFVATVDNDIVGWVHLTLPEVDHLGHTAELSVGVSSDYQRQGIGSRLLRNALAWAAMQGYQKIHQSLPATNTDAIGVLLTHDWAIEAVRKDHYQIDGELVDEVMLAVML